MPSMMLERTPSAGRMWRRRGLSPAPPRKGRRPAGTSRRMPAPATFRHGGLHRDPTGASAATSSKFKPRPSGVWQRDRYARVNLLTGPRQEPIEPMMVEAGRFVDEVMRARQYPRLSSGCGNAIGAPGNELGWLSDRRLGQVFCARRQAA